MMKQAPFKITRRMLLAASGVGVAGATIVGVRVATRRNEQFIIELLAQAIPDLPRNTAAFQQFANNYMRTRPPHQVSKISTLAAISGLIGVGLTGALLAGNVSYQTFRRLTLTNFLVQTNYFSRSSADEEVLYLGELKGCGNPFAQFD